VALARVTALRRRQRPDLFVVAAQLTETNSALLAALRRRDVAAEWLPPDAIDSRLAPGDVVLSRLEVRETLDGVEAGAWELCRAARAGVTVLNETSALLRSHDKLATALALAEAGVPHPRTAQVGEPGVEPPLPLPVVVKPRFGSWGKDVFACQSSGEFDRCLREIRDRSWFRFHGALVQELVPPQGHDLRVLIACGSVVGSVARHAPPGEWRTNVALGARRLPAVPGERAIDLALGAARAVGGDLVGIDLLPLPDGDYVALEVNAAVDFTSEYSLHGGSVFGDVAEVLAAVCSRPTADAAVPASRPHGGPAVLLSDEAPAEGARA
jgi:[lysine-biosynthesis-protein LysW]---L-2-aminoadipate ligase